jgi:hypothetical protein
MLRDPQGLVDLDAEIAKCEKKLQLAQLNLDKVRKVEAQADYVETVPANVRLVNEDRVRLASIFGLRILETLMTKCAEENVRGGSRFVGVVEGDVYEVEINTYTVSANQVDLKDPHFRIIFRIIFSDHYLSLRGTYLLYYTGDAGSGY